MNHVSCLANDRLPRKLVDGVRYEKAKHLRKKISEGIATKRAADKEKDEATKRAKKAKATYLVNSDKYGAKATEEELAQELTEQDLGTEDTCRILQCKIR